MELLYTIAGTPLLVSAILLFVYMVSVFGISLYLKSNGVVDVAYGLGFILVTATIVNSFGRYPLGGLLLVLPGFITDAIGLLLLVAPLRSWLTRTFGGAVSRHAQQSRRQDGVVDLDPDEWQRVPDRELPGRPKPPRRGEPD